MDEQRSDKRRPSDALSERMDQDANQDADQEAGQDAALLARFAAGDGAAAQILIDRLAPRLLSLAARLLGDRSEAEDVVQEAMLRLWRAADGWEDRGARASTWAHQVTRNLCLDRLRRRRGAPLEDAPEPIDPSPTVEGRLIEAAEADALTDAVDALPARQRAAVTLRHFEERSNPEIAEALDVSVEAVESLLARGRRALKAALGGARAAEEETGGRAADDARR